VAGLSRSQLLLYGAIAVAVLLVGVRWVRSADTASGAGQPAVAPSIGGAEAGGGAESFAVEDGDGGVVVHVAGEVRDPGVYRLPLGARVTDAVERAGGPRPDAAEDAINLAAKLADGSQVILPARAKGPVGASGGTAAAGDGLTDQPISLGTATVEQLDTIEGIGPVTAQDILDYRDEHGGVGSVEDLDQISGIGPATMEALRGALQP
jgi:competence protein ComEA